MNHPVLYSFRRCPYAIRARIALHYSGVVCELREVVLKSKPDHMLSVSPKGTVPVLLCPSDAEHGFKVIEESIDVVAWALSQSDDTDNWLHHSTDHELIQRCDDEFKSWLDRYKYADRHPECEPQVYFDNACVFLKELESCFVSAGDGYFIESASISVLDIAIFPFIRQFAFVDKPKFDALDLPKLQSWLAALLDSPVFLNVMTKYPMWVDGETDIVWFGKAVEN